VINTGPVVPAEAMDRLLERRSEIGLRRTLGHSRAAPITQIRAP